MDMYGLTDEVRIASAVPYMSPRKISYIFQIIHCGGGGGDGDDLLELLQTQLEQDFQLPVVRCLGLANTSYPDFNHGNRSDQLRI